jgi:hypothetical protein
LVPLPHCAAHRYDGFMNMTRVVGMSMLALVCACKPGADKPSVEKIGETGWTLSVPKGYRVIKHVDYGTATGTKTVDPTRFDIQESGGTGIFGEIWVSDEMKDEAGASAYCSSGEPKFEKLGADGVLVTCLDGNSAESYSWVKGADGVVMACGWRSAATRDEARKVCGSLKK